LSVRHPDPVAKEFGVVLKKLKAGEPVEAEVNARRIKVVGTTTIGASFNVEGNLVTSDANFIRLLPERSPAAIDVGVVRLRPDADPRQVKADLQRIYGSDLLVLTSDEFATARRTFSCARDRSALSSRLAQWLAFSSASPLSTRCCSPT
jgi:hypothetical protein